MVHPGTGRQGGGSSRQGTARGGTTPQAVQRIEAKVAAAAAAAAERSVTRIGPQDLFYGTCMRFNRGETGRLGVKDMWRFMRELRCKVGDVEMKHLVGWYDEGGRDEVVYKRLVRSMFGGGGGGGQPNSQALTARQPGGRGGADTKMDFRADGLTARAKRAGVLAEKARLEQRIRDVARKERMIKGKIDSIRTGRSGR